MVREMIDGKLRQTNLTNESADYLSKREEVRRAEIELRNQRKTGLSRSRLRIRDRHQFRAAKLVSVPISPDFRTALILVCRCSFS